MFRRSQTIDPMAELAKLERQTAGLMTANGAVIFKATQPTVGYSWGPSVITVRP